MTPHPGASINGIQNSGLTECERIVRSAHPAGTIAQSWCAESPVMRRLLGLATRIATVDSTVLITGESGVGKERVARFLHDRSRRARGPFVGINCGAYADALLESELFGHVRGAFTGAVQDRLGVFEAAQGGTLFLDEIGDTSAAMQVKLLRVVQERQLRRVGELKVRPVDVRIITATHRDLRQEVVQQRFRQDLYYRLHVIELVIPPLRDRPEDLRTLAEELLTHTSMRLQRPLVGYTSRALEHVLRYTWPGNVRELEHAIERACVLATGPLIDVQDLPDAVCSGLPPDPIHARPLREVAREHQRAYALETLKRCDGNRRRAAEALRISATTLKRRLRAPERGRWSLVQESDGSASWHATPLNPWFRCLRAPSVRRPCKHGLAGG
jgi:two-component system, NtrC family, response regulator HydG